MSDSEKELLNGNSIDEITVDELNLKTAQASNKGRKKSEKTGFLTTVKAEFGKIIWPNKQSLARQTIAVVVCSVVLGLVIFGLDMAINAGFKNIFVK